MPRKSWIIRLESGAWIEIERDTVAGKIVSFRVVMLMEIEGTGYCIARHDTAHGFAHRDVLGRTEGLRGKLPSPMLNYNQAFRYAVRDIQHNADHYLADFLAH